MIHDTINESCWIWEEKGNECTWFMGSQDEEGRCGAVTRGRLLAHMSKPKGRAACLRTHLGPIRNTSHRNTHTHTRTHKLERDTHACTHTGRVEVPHRLRRIGGRLAEC